MSSWDWQLLGCHEKGIEAFRAGKKLEDCPYRGRAGFNGQRAEYWRDGWRAASKKDGSAFREHRDLRESSL